MFNGLDLMILIIGILAVREMFWCHENNWYDEFED